ncbi:Uncharacterised protein r2_g1101 [Pycnogonum litorale]
MASNFNFKDTQYCANPFKTHRKKISSYLRVVPDSLRIGHPVVVLKVNQRLCRHCFDKMKALATHDQTYSHDNSTKEHDNDGPFKEQHIELATVNESLKLLDQTPVSKRHMKSSKRYSKTKFKKIRTSLRKKLEIATGASISPGSSAEDGDGGKEMLDQLKEKFIQSISRSERLTILTILPKSWSRSKIKAEFGISDYIARQSKRLVSEKGILASPNPRCGKSLSESIVQKVVEFYKSEDVSRMPGKKDFISVREGNTRYQRQKQLVLCNIKEAYQLFKERHLELKIGFSKFADLKPKECVLAGSPGTHSVCVCTIHQNLKLMMIGAKMREFTADHPDTDTPTCSSDSTEIGQHFQTPLLNYRHCLAAIQCNPEQIKCHLGKCDQCPGTDELKNKLFFVYDTKSVDEINYKQWSSTDRSTLSTTTDKFDDFLDNLCERLKNLRFHDFIASSQSQYLQKQKRELKYGEFLVILDFSENYAFIVQDAAQSFHWNNNQATIHPFVIYFNNGDDIKNISFVIVSESLHHDVTAVHLFQSKFIQFLKNKFNEIQKIIYFSDGCAAQYKNGKNFFNLSQHEKDFGIPAEWNFFATSHGKGPCDGVGGTVKRLAARASLQRTYNQLILTPEQLYEFAVQAIPSVNFSFLTTEQHRVHHQFLSNRFLTARTIPGMFESRIIMKFGFKKAQTLNSE